MPSPFPGMDPFIESQRWEDFLHALPEVIRECLIPHVRPRYVVLVEERVYVEWQTNGRHGLIIPDVTVLGLKDRQSPSKETTSPAPAVAVAPVVLTLPMPEHKREAFLTIRERETMEVVTVIEALSPDDKRPGADGRREHLRKRETVIESNAHLIELDLLRGGERLPTVESLPSADYYAFVSRAHRRPKVEVYPWTLRQALPTIPVPLASDDSDVLLDLQFVFNTLYDRAGYDYSLDYRRPIEPTLSEADRTWAHQMLDAVS